jgi:hypothetical protein
MIFTVGSVNRKRSSKERYMKNMISTLLKIRRSLPVATVLVLVTIGFGYGADSIDVPPITPLFEQQPDSLNRKPGIPGRKGFIERVDHGLVVISDVTRRLASNARYYRQYKGVSIFLSEFQIGTYVGFVLNEQAEIDVMWIAE